jgi:hypothetical protein
MYDLPCVQSCSNCERLVRYRAKYHGVLLHNSEPYWHQVDIPYAKCSVSYVRTSVTNINHRIRVFPFACSSKYENFYEIIYVLYICPNLTDLTYKSKSCLTVFNVFHTFLFLEGCACANLSASGSSIVCLTQIITSYPCFSLNSVNSTRR